MSPQTKCSELERTIQPEIKDDEFYYAIAQISCFAKINTVLEIGSSAGGGSTEAFVKGLRHNSNRPSLFCLEVSQARFEKLSERYRREAFVKCYRASSVPADCFPSHEEVTHFYCTTPTALNKHPLEKVLGWLDQDIKYIRMSGAEQNGVQQIRASNQIDKFDVVLIDGSEFSGESELKATYGAKILLLDDVNGFKNAANHRRLSSDPAHDVLLENLTLRNGYAIFKRADFSFTLDLNRALPFAVRGPVGTTLCRVGRKLGRIIDRLI